MEDTLKLIVFDLGGTVFSKGKQAFIDLLTNQLDVDRKSIEYAIDGPHALQYRRNEISADEYWKKVKETLPQPIGQTNLEKLWFDQYVPLPGMSALIATLRKHYRVAYLSNNTPERVGYLQKKYNFLNWFNGGLFSYEAGAVKSDGGMYEKLVTKFEGVLPKQTLIIDDREQNLEKPAQAGFHTLVFQNPDQLKELLKENGVLRE